MRLLRKCYINHHFVRLTILVVPEKNTKICNNSQRFGVDVGKHVAVG